MFDVILIAIFGIVTWSVAAEGAGGAGVILIGVILSGLLAMNFFEPLADFLERNISASPEWDVLCLVGLFVVFVFIYRIGADRLSPGFPQMQPMVYEVGRWSCGALTGYVTMAFLATALHTAPFPRDFWGQFPPELDRREGPLSSSGPDYQWLGFTQYVSEKVFSHPRGGRVFDGPKYRAGEHEGRWPSFPIRYATRREEIEKGGSVRGISQGQPDSVEPAKAEGEGGLGF
ncbi:MAG: CvpA family protein [Planctomycetes bacterium]|nr:CvpA family protein [Planctomycetota bacterium]